jgi:hypothetical protein
MEYISPYSAMYLLCSLLKRQRKVSEAHLDETPLNVGFLKAIQCGLWDMTIEKCKGTREDKAKEQKKVLGRTTEECRLL